MTLKKNNRKYYKKPQVNQVKLEIGEAVLSACKTTQGATTGKQPGNYCGGSGCKLTLGS